MHLGSGPSPHELVRRAAAEPGLVALIGDWFDGTALLASRPVQVTTDTSELDDGGMWLGSVDFDGTAHFGRYDHVLRHRDGEWWFTGAPAALVRWRALLAAPAPDVRSRSTLDDLPSRSAHLAAVERAVGLIRAGELYQVNVCTRLGGAFAGHPAALFADLVADLRPARAALVVRGDRALVSAGPELFLDVRDREVRTAPIKGTLPRSADDDGNEQRLRNSAKDAAENVMIVDLLRNDLGRVCQIGSVRADSLLDVEPHPGVWHLVSTVTGRLRPEVGVGDLLTAMVPPGSVTGAPKLRAVAVAADLEPVPRGAYTGTVGAVLPGGRAEFAVTIRSFEITPGRWQLGVGGGVTADSVPMAEWQECRHKAAPLLRVAGVELPTEPTPPPFDPALLETLLAVDGRVLRLADHLARLDRSARELTGRGVPADVADRVTAAAAGRPGRTVVRVVLRDGAASVSAGPVGPPPVASELRSVVRPPGSWRHKWADRALLGPDPDALFVAPDGAVLETQRGNVFVLCDDGSLVTPPLRDDLLPGVTRRAVLDLAHDTGRPVALREFGLDELVRHAAFCTSSLSGAVPIRSIDGHVLPSSDGVVAGFTEVLLGGTPGGR